MVRAAQRFWQPAARRLPFRQSEGVDGTEVQPALGRLGNALALLLAVVLLGSCTAGGRGATRSDGSSPPQDASSVRPAQPVTALHVQANRMVDQDGHTLQLRGVNRSGSEYACVQGWGFTDGPVDDASLGAVEGWGANALRVPLNEDCWLGLGAPSQFTGQKYRDFVRDLVGRLHSHGLVPVLDLQWSRSRGGPATRTAQLPDAEHAPEFWSSVAGTFRDDPAVLFDLFNEPREVSWDCWRDGCTVEGSWRAAGMQSLVDAVRAAGARQPVLIGGLGYANDLSGWLDHAPRDPAGQLVASFHLYDDNACRVEDCWDRTVAAVARRVPVVTGEVGEYDRGTSLLGAYLPWADRNEVSYLGWSWNVWSQPTALITSYDGVPTAYGKGLRDHLLARAGRMGSGTPAAVPLSRGRPVVASSETYPATYANDGDRTHQWRSAGYPAWIAYDLSDLLEAQRHRVLSTWMSRGTYDYDASVFPGPTYNLPADYVIEAANGAPGRLPEAGWTTLVAERGSAVHSAAHVLALGGRTWVRLRATAGAPSNAAENTDCALTWDLYDASTAARDAWIFYGDSITAGAMSPAPGPEEGASPPFAAQVQAAHPSLAVSQQNGGVGGLTLHQAVSTGLLERWLAAFPGHYVGLSLGTNDASRTNFSAAAYAQDLRASVGLVERAGKVPVVPTLVASRTAEVQANGPAANAVVRDLYASDRLVVAGPDLWSLFTAHPEWLSADLLHPGPQGSAALRDAWAAVALRNVYAEAPR